MSKESGAPPGLNIGAVTQGDIAPVALYHTTSPLPSSSFTLPLAGEDTEALASISAARLEQVDKECEGNSAEQRESTEELTGDSDSGVQTEEVQTERGRGRGRYEYMDIRRSDSTEGEDPAQEEYRSPTSAKSTTETEMLEVSKREQSVEEEEEKYHSTNKQPPPDGDLCSVVMPRPDVHKGGGEKVEEYEEMTRLEATPDGWDQANYENLPVRVCAVYAETDDDGCARIGDYIKVCAGMGEPGGSTSFDNPDYWHSRLFLKPDAVRT